MALDERTLRAAGLPASLISLLVSITKAAERAAAAANTAATATDLSAQIGAAIRVLDNMGAVPGLDEKITALAHRVDEIEVLDGAIVDLDVEGGFLIKIMADGSRVTGPAISQPLGNSSRIILTGGSLSLDGDDLVITPPTASIQDGVDFLTIFEQAIAEAQS